MYAIPMLFNLSDSNCSRKMKTKRKHIVMVFSHEYSCCLGEERIRESQMVAYRDTEFIHVRADNVHYKDITPVRRMFMSGILGDEP
jgi:hypothetical protein